MNYDIRHLAMLLGKRCDDPVVLALIGGDQQRISRVEHLGYAELKPVGIEVVFAEAAYLTPQLNLPDPSALHIDCFHLHSDGHEGYAGYPAALPHGVSF